MSWSAKDNLAVTGYQIRYRRGTTGTYSAIQSTTLRTHTLTLTTGAWTIAVRASDAAGNWSTWRYGRVTVDAIAPTMTSLRSSMTVVRSVNSRFTASWAATDNIGVTHYQWRRRGRPNGTPSIGTTVSTRSGTFLWGAGTWELEVRARDAVGNWSAWRMVTVLVPRDDRQFSFSAGTTRRTHAAAYRRTLTTTNVMGAQMVVTTADGNGFFLVGRVGPAYGRLRVTVDGESWMVDTAYYRGVRATSYHDRVLLFSMRFAPGPHTVTITNLATTHRPTIAIDSLDFAR